MYICAYIYICIYTCIYIYIYTYVCRYDLYPLMIWDFNVCIWPVFRMKAELEKLKGISAAVEVLCGENHLDAALHTCMACTHHTHVYIHILTHEYIYIYI